MWETTRTLCKKVVQIVVVFFTVGLAISACSMPFEWAGAMPDSFGEEPETADNADAASNPGGTDDDSIIAVTGASFTLAWDPGSAEAVGYRLYWRSHGAQEWQLLADGIADPSYTVTTSDLAYGTYEFAVSAVGAGGLESALHTSQDAAADPKPWYLSWSEA